MRKRKKDHVKIPRSVQDAIPISTIYDDGLFCVGKNQYSRTYQFEDINYQVASEQDKETMFERYCGLLNSLDSSAVTKITINNRKLNQTDFENRIFIREQNDNLNEYRSEYNRMLLAKATAGNSILQEKYVIVSGLARGADAVVAHTAMACGGKTIAVIGSGLGTHYPYENEYLYEQIAENGLILSDMGSF